MREVQTKGGGIKALTYQVTQVAQPLTSVAKVCDAGNYVAFGRRGGMIISEDKKERTMVERVKDLYILDVMARATDFRRQEAKP